MEEYTGGNEINKLGAKKEFGCKNGLCWTTCIGAIPWWGVEHCYSSRYGFLKEIAKCSWDSDCKLEWRCGGPCTAFSV